MSDLGNFKGLLSIASERKWGKIIDELKQWDNRWLEMADGWIGKYGVRGIDDWLGDKPAKQAILEPLANDLTDRVYELVIDEDLTAQEEVIRLAKELIKEIIPLEKLVGQSGEDQIMDFIESLIAEWLIKK